MKTQFFRCFVSCLFIVSTLAGTAQKKKDSSPPPDFPSEELFTILRTSINKYRAQNGIDSMDNHDVLKAAAEKSSASMAKAGKADPMAGGKTPGEKLAKAGGTKKAEEVAFAVMAVKGKKNYTAQEMADQIMKKWTTDKVAKVVLLKPEWVFNGFGVTPDKDNKKYYISCMVGGFASFNSGAKKKSELKVPFNTKSKKMKGPDAKACKNCNAWKDFENLRNGLKVENGKIYLEYNNIKYLKKLLKKPKDGLAVDIVQFAQYQKPDYNIVDNNLMNKGVMSKVMSSEKIFSKNEIKPDPKAKKKQKINKLRVALGTFPKGITGKYELNLIVVQDGKICKTVLRAYLEQGDQESNTPLEMLKMPEAEGANVPRFEPKGETSILNFVVPFEKNKSEFKPEDIKPLLDALQEPDFMIEGLYIYAYSSIEGDSVANARLQRKRAESITKVLQQLNQSKVEPMIVTNDSWLLFQMELEDGQYDYLTKMSKREAIRKINGKPELLKELEPTLSKQRFAQIVMDVTYDISGSKEEKFCYLKFNQAVRQGNFKQAYKIMDHIYNSVNEGRYTADAWDKLEIPFEKQNAGVLMMKKYYEYLKKGRMVDEDDYAEVSRISDLDPSNSYIKFNKLYCKILADSTIGNESAQAQTQAAIDAFYTGNMPKKHVDGLNVEWNFKQIDYYDTIEGMEPKVDACIERIKKFYNFKEASWQNALKLAYAFTRSKDYEFAANLLEPYVKRGEGDQNLLFTYISLASHVPAKFFARGFSDALAKAKEQNPERYCKLFGDPYMSFQVLDNPNVKKVYMEASCPK